MASGPITSCQIDGATMETVRDSIFLGSKITADGECRHEIKRRLLLGRKAMTSLDIIVKSRDITLPTKVCHVWMWELDHKESLMPKNWCFWRWCWRRLLRVPEGNQSWIFIGRTDAEAETPILWPPDEKNWFIWKDPDAVKVWRQEEKGQQRMR